MLVLSPIQDQSLLVPDLLTHSPSYAESNLWVEANAASGPQISALQVSIFSAVQFITCFSPWYKYKSARSDHYIELGAPARGFLYMELKTRD